jgi:hypothetical protein
MDAANFVDFFIMEPTVEDFLTRFANMCEQGALGYSILSGEWIFFLRG